MVVPEDHLLSDLVFVAVLEKAQIKNRFSINEKVAC